MSDLEILIGELEGYSKSLNYKMKGYTQIVNGEEVFSCLICGHCPALLLERLRAIAATRSDTPEKEVEV